MADNTQAIPGFDGIIKISKDGGTTFNKIAEIREMELNIDADLIDAFSHDSDGWREFIPGPKTWTVTGEALWVSQDVAQTDLFDIMAGNVKFDLEFIPKVGTGLPEFTGKALMSTFAESSPNDDAAALSLEIQGSGCLVKGTLP